MIMTTVACTNMDEIPEIIDTAVAYKADVFAFARYCPTSEEKEYEITQACTGCGNCVQNFPQQKGSRPSLETGINMQEEPCSDLVQNRALPA